MWFSRKFFAPLLIKESPLCCYRFSHRENFLIDLAVLALHLFLLRFFAPSGERFLRDLSRTNPCEAVTISNDKMAFAVAARKTNLQSSEAIAGLDEKTGFSVEGHHAVRGVLTSKACF